VVRDPEVHAAVLREVLEFAVEHTRLLPLGLSWSPILGPEGNVEFLCHFNRNVIYDNVTYSAPASGVQALIPALVEAAHKDLRGVQLEK
jgi:23S rRNA (cytidine1920-2'-O)/16S rRNA (cytidine1409-2'-O)-methyltransferase